MNEQVIYNSLECILKMLETLAVFPEVMKDEAIRNQAQKYIESTLKQINELQKEKQDD